ncbi:MAG: Crp/Fnr family transcriptional regulator [Parafilimonas sp.]
MIQEDVLLAMGTFRKYKKGKCIFFEGDAALFYHQVSEGSVRMVNNFANGKEFIQGSFKPGESFGEPVLLIDAAYPATAIANEHTVVLRIAKENFLCMLLENNEMLFAFAQLLSKRLFMKATIAREISGEKPMHRVLTLLSILKKENGDADKKFKVELSRQRIGDMLGLRVETVIRTMKQLEEKGFITIKNGKAYL